MTIETDAEKRKAMPITTGVLDYFPDALLAVAQASLAGNQQHGLGPLHWDRARSTDEADALVRHLIERGTLDTDGVRHTAKVAWRALALLQREIEAERFERPVPDGKPCNHPVDRRVNIPGTTWQRCAVCGGHLKEDL